MNKPLIVYVANLDCESEAAAIERGFRDVVGVVRLKVYPKSSKVELTFDESKTSGEAIVQKLASLGFPAKKGSDEAGPPSPWRNPKVLASVGSGLLLLLAWLLTLGGIQPLALSAFKQGISTLTRLRRPASSTKPRSLKHI